MGGTFGGSRFRPESVPCELVIEAQGEDEGHGFVRAEEAALRKDLDAVIVKGALVGDRRRVEVGGDAPVRLAALARALVLPVEIERCACLSLELEELFEEPAGTTLVKLPLRRLLDRSLRHATTLADARARGKNSIRTAGLRSRTKRP